VSAQLSYLVVIEEGETSFGASVPDLPGCMAVADTIEEVQTLIREAIELDIGGLREDGGPVPPPHSSARPLASHS
jgi:predicted RNase H-like HicB family nuclease